MERYYLLTIIYVYTCVETPITFLIPENEDNKNYTIDEWENWYEKNYDDLTAIDAPCVFKQDSVIVKIINVIIQA